MNEYKLKQEDLLKCQSVIESIARELGGGELGIDYNNGRWYFTFGSGNYLTTSAGAMFDDAYYAAKLAIEKM